MGFEVDVLSVLEWKLTCFLCEASELTWFECGDRNGLDLSVVIRIEMLFVRESKITFSVWMDVDLIFALESKLAWFLCEGSKATSFSCAGRKDLAFVCGIEINFAQCGGR